MVPTSLQLPPNKTTLKIASVAYTEKEKRGSLEEKEILNKNMLGAVLDTAWAPL